VEAEKIFTDLAKANEYFAELCRIRTGKPASVVGVTGQDIKKYFRIDEKCYVGRVVLDLEWT
jgi:enoyl reductase-like protein